MKPSFRFLNAPIEQITVPSDAMREQSSVVDDDILAKSIREGEKRTPGSGIQQPLVLIADGERFRLVDGSRRLAIASALGLPRVPAVVAVLPDGERVDDYARRLRFMLDQHRQDLMPSQRAELILKLKEMMGLNNMQVAAFLGVDQDSITNWLSVLRYVPAVVAAMDAGRLSQKAARAFDGLSEGGQEAIWKRHGKELVESKTDHKKLRAQYPPERHPDFYKKPEKTAKKLAVKQGGRKAAKRVDYTAAEKKRLLHSVEMKEAELNELKEEARELKREINDATPIVAAIVRNKALWALVPADVRPELERFAEVYV